MPITRRLAAALVLALALLPLAAAAQNASTKVTFILVNDIYQMDEQTVYDGKTRGGFARLAAVVKAERAKGGHVIFAHAGDTLSPSLMSGFDRGAHIIALTNLITPDIFVPGNHEFDFGKQVFLTRMAEARFPLYAANLRGPDGQPLPGFKDRTILTFDGVRVGLVGATADDSPAKSNPEDLKFSPTVATVREQGVILRGAGADLVVAVVHAPRRQDRELYDSRAADLILTGDDHDLFINFDGLVAIVESSYDAHFVTAIDVTINVTERGGKREVTWWPQFRVMDTAHVTPDPEVAAAVAKLKEDLAHEFDVVLGTTAVELDSRIATLRAHEAAIGNLIADALRVQNGADVAVMNGGGIRGGKVYPPGSTLTRRDVLAEIPFGNKVVLLEISGRDLRRAMENGLSIAPQTSGRFPQVSGMTVDVDLKRPAGERVLGMTVGGAPLDEEKSYKLVTNDYLARGGDGYAIFRDAKPLTRDYDGSLVANDVMVHVRRLGTVRTGVDGRLRVR